MRTLRPPAESHILIVGAARNVEPTLARQIQVFARAFRSFRKVSYFVVESDSCDSTLKELAELKRTRPGFDYESLGLLESRFPQRTDRLVIARNRAVEWSGSSAEGRDADYIAVADMDGVNLHLTAPAVESCWTLDNWDVVTANQPGGYYDVWALRHEQWHPEDCWTAFRALQSEFEDDVAHQIAVAAKRIRIRPEHAPIEVKSAFGGLAIYRAETFRSGRYTPAASECETCEHVSFHAALRAAGARIIINPALVNIDSLDAILPWHSPRRHIHALRRLLRR